MGRFDITPWDPMGAANDWKQSLAQTAILEQSAKSAQLRGKVEQMNFAASEKFHQAVTSIPQDIPMEDRFGKIADAALAAGDVQSAEMAMARLGTLHNMQSQKDARDALAEERRTKADATATEWELRLAEAARTPEEMKSFNDLYKNHFGRDSSLLTGPMDPKMRQAAAAALTKGRSDQLDQLNATRAKAEARRAEAEARRSERADRLEKLKEREIDIRERAGGKAGAPKVDPKALEATRTQLKSLFPGLSPSDLSISAQQVYQAARARYAQEGGGDFNLTVTKVIASKAEHFQTTPAKSFLNMGMTPESTRFSPSLPMPKDLKSLKVNEIYHNKDGKRAVWDGTTMRPLDHEGE